MANSSGHMSHHGAHGTEWTLVAPNELARLASLQLVATRRLPRVQGGRPPTASACQSGGVDPTRGRRPWVRLAPSDWIWRRTSFRSTGQMPPARSCSASGCGGPGLAFLAAQPPCTVAMEACAGRPLLGARDRQAGPRGAADPAGLRQAVRQAAEEQCADAEAICEAAQRPTMRFVPAKSEEQQASRVPGARSPGAAAHAVINALRGHLPEYGSFFPRASALMPRSRMSRTRTSLSRESPDQSSRS